MIRQYLSIVENAEKQKPELFEGIRHGAKEANKVLSNPNDYNIGVEFEIHTSDELYDSVYGSENNIEVTDLEYEPVYDFNDVKDIYHGNVKGVIRYTTEGGTIFYFHEEFMNEDGESMVESDVNDAIYTDLWAFESSNDFADVLEGFHELIRLGAEFIESLDKPIDDLDDPEVNYNLIQLSDHRLYHIAKLLNKYDESSFIDAIYMTMFEEDINVLGGLSMSHNVNDIKKGISLIQSLTSHEDVISWLESNEDLESIIDGLVEFFELLNDIGYSEFATPDYTEEGGHTGVTYEVAMFGDNENESIFNVLENHNVSYDTVTHDGEMVEVITYIMPLDKALVNMQNMFNLIDSDPTIFTNDTTGLHISISTNKWNRGFIDWNKLVVLMNYQYIHTVLFPEREHVIDINTKVIQEMRNNMDDVMMITKTSKNIEVLYNRIFVHIINMERITFNKHQSINASQYNTHHGRIELRHFGGEDYEKRFDEIKNELVRTLAIMDIAYGDMYQQEYTKAKYVYMDDMFEKAYGIGAGATYRLCKAIDAMGYDSVGTHNISEFLGRLKTTQRNDLITMVNTLRGNNNERALVGLLNDAFFGD